jgi:hypothetical protein
MKASSSTSSSERRTGWTLLLKAAVLLAPFVALSLPAIARTLVVVVRAEQSLALKDGVFDGQLEGKLDAMLTDGIVVIVAGDSRAEEQVIPALIEARTGLPAINVATTAGDLVTLANALKRHGVPRSARVLIVSTSLFQVNDGAIDPPYISTACLLNLTTWERVRIYADRLSAPTSPLDFRFVEPPPVAMTAAKLRDHGFVANDKILSLPLPKVLLNAHPWYRSLSLRGARWRVFREALGRLAATGLRIYLVDAPVSPAWRAYTAGTFVDAAERDFAGMLDEAASAWPAVQALDYYTVPDPALGNEQFADIQHLNRAGAQRFTTMLLDRVDLTMNDIRTAAR